MKNFVLLVWEVGGRWVKNVLCHININNTHTHTHTFLGSLTIPAHVPLLQILLIGYHSTIASHQVLLFRSRVPVCDFRGWDCTAAGPTNCYWSSLNTWDVWVFFTYLSIHRSTPSQTFRDFLSSLNYKMNESQTHLWFCYWGNPLPYWEEFMGTSW